MPRRRCCGLVEQEPRCQFFIPHGQKSPAAVELYVEELEAVRLKDVEDLDQAECAVSMGLSRPTFQRILQSARTKIATALVEGHAIMIKGGHYLMKNRVFECRGCGYTWEVEPCSEGGKHGYEIACPKCGSMDKFKVGEDGTKHCCGARSHGHSHRHGGGCCGH